MDAENILGLPCLKRGFGENKEMVGVEQYEEFAENDVADMLVHRMTYLLLLLAFMALGKL